jgi:hypothetical protein
MIVGPNAADTYFQSTSLKKFLFLFFSHIIVHFREEESSASIDKQMVRMRYTILFFTQAALR